MRYLALATFTAAAALSAAPALAQDIDTLTVTGHGPRAQSLSEAVSYADLDLTLRADRATLQRRVSDTAGRLCDELNQDPATHHNMGKSCKDVAIRDAMGQVRQAFADASASPAYVDAFGTPASATAPDRPYAQGPNGQEGGFESNAYTVSTVENAPIPDTAANRARYGGPMSRAGQRTAAKGN
jgi:UrcA family protein